LTFYEIVKVVLPIKRAYRISAETTRGKCKAGKAMDNISDTGLFKLPPGARPIQRRFVIITLDRLNWFAEKVSARR
jgi:hypothetical protein